MSDVTVPVFPESVSDGTLVAWRRHAGEAVARGEILADIETDKVVFEVPAPADGTLTEIVVPAGSTVLSGQLIAKLGAAPAGEEQSPAQVAVGATAPVAPAPATAKPDMPAAIMPAAEKLMRERGLGPADVTGSGKDGRVLKEDVLKVLAGREAATARTKSTAPAPVARPPAPATKVPAREEGGEERPERRVPMSRLRARIAERLLEAQHTAAILTTFNEVNMQPVMALRKRYQERFEQEHGVRLGFMSFFVKASIETLKRFPEVNASIDGSDVVYHGFFDIGIAVSSPRGLVVPILRDADQLSMAQIETKIKDFGQKAQEGKLAIEDITGGTFSISNGGVFGSLMSTPILNPPQSAILGMHKIQERPIAENGEVVIRPMMYLALSYDHRLVDGREAVQFLVTIKELLEDPAGMLLEM
jgi:2-oxoglutarate dehydrogenase E2 component (dihydrolipoamide succinyltransferase)